MPTTKASRNVIVATIGGARAHSPAVVVVRAAIAVARVPVAALVARGMSSEARVDLIKIAADREVRVVAADSAGLVPAVDALRSAATSIAIARRARLSRRARSW